MSLNLVINDNKPPITEIYLEQDASGVDIVVKDSQGDVYYLLRIKDDGTFYRHEHVESVDFKVDKEGKINESEEY